LTINNLQKFDPSHVTAQAVTAPSRKVADDSRFDAFAVKSARCMYLHVPAYSGVKTAGFSAFMHPVMHLSRDCHFLRRWRFLAAIPQCFAAKRRKNRKKLPCLAVLTLSIPFPARRKRAG
jgi:hypothetical protein